MLIFNFILGPKIDNFRTGAKGIIHGFTILGWSMDLAQIVHADSTSQDKLNDVKFSLIAPS